MSASKFTVDYFIKKFSAIPAKKWCVHDYTDERGRHCVLGHCGERWKGGSLSTSQSQDLKEIFRAAGLNAIKTNDGDMVSFPQSTPKARILAALKWIKKRNAKKAS